MTKTLSPEEFHVLADRLGVPTDVRDELYPMVRDLRSLADRLNDLIVPEFHTDIPVTALSGALHEGQS